MWVHNMRTLNVIRLETLSLYLEHAWVMHLKIFIFLARAVHLYPLGCTLPCDFPVIENHNFISILGSGLDLVLLFVKSTMKINLLIEAASFDDDLCDQPGAIFWRFSSICFQEIREVLPQETHGDHSSGSPNVNVWTTHITPKFGALRGPKIYTCGTCGQVFKDRSNFKRHERIHTGERPYRCWFCGSSFSQSNTLKQHIKCKHGAVV